MPLLEVDDVSFAYGHDPALSGVSLAFRCGETVALLGPNGSGKTTLLKVLLGLVRPQTGEVRLDGRRLARWAPKELAREIAYVPQVHREAFAFTVRDVVRMGRLPHRAFLAPLTAEDRRVADEALEEIGITHLAERPYTAISGGERQLALIARAVAQGGRLFVMDEPNNGLDYGHQMRLLDRIAALGRAGRTIVFSSHHPDHALAAAGRVVMLCRGKIVADGPRDRVITSESLEALYDVEVRVVSAAGVPVCVPAGRFREIDRDDPASP